MSSRCRRRGSWEAGEASKREASSEREGVILSVAKNLSVLLFVLALFACKREERDFHGLPSSAAISKPPVREVELVAGGVVAADSGPGPYEDNAYAVSQGPYRSGRSRQGEPVRARHQIPSKTCRRSLGGRPIFGIGGSTASSRSHCASVRSPRDI